MVYYEDEKLIIRSMDNADAQIFTDEFAAQGWHPDIAVYMSRLKEQSEKKCFALTAVFEGCPAGYVYVYLHADEEVAKAVELHKEYIMKETLAADLAEGTVEDKVNINGHDTGIAIEKK